MKPLKNKVSITLDSDIIESVKAPRRAGRPFFFPIYQYDIERISDPGGQKERSVKHLCLMLLSS